MTGWINSIIRFHIMIEGWYSLLPQNFGFIRSEDQELTSREIFLKCDHLLNWWPSAQALKHLHFTTKLVRASNIYKRKNIYAHLNLEETISFHRFTIFYYNHAVNAGHLAILVISTSRLYVNYLDQLFNYLG